MLGDHTLTVSIGDREFTLRPSLRAALAAERRCNGLQNLTRDIVDFRTWKVARLIAIASVDLLDEGEVHLSICQPRALARREKIAGQLLDLIAAMYSLDEPVKASPKGTPSGTRTSLEASFVELFTLGTGWLGWSPDVTWNASPAEITAAYQGRLDMLKALFGEAEGGKGKKAKAPATLSKAQHNARLLSFFPRAIITPRTTGATDA